MKALCWYGKNDVRVATVPDPKILNPRDAIIKITRGTLRKNAWGDVTILDPEFHWTFDVSRSRSKSRNTPFDGKRMRGAAVATIVGGRVVYLHPEFARISETKRGEAAVK